MTTPITPEQAKNLIDVIKLYETPGCIGIVPKVIMDAAKQVALQSAARPEPHGPTDEALAALIKSLWLAAKPSKEAQLIRSNIAVDSGKYPTEDCSYIPDYVWDMVDIAAQRGIEQGRGEALDAAAPAPHPAKAGDKVCAGAPDGWKLLPLELTDDMAEVIAEHCRCCGGIAETIYTALLAASPAAMETKGEK